MLDMGGAPRLSTISLRGLANLGGRPQCDRSAAGQCPRPKRLADQRRRLCPGTSTSAHPVPGSDARRPAARVLGHIRRRLGGSTRVRGAIRCQGRASPRGGAGAGRHGPATAHGSGRRAQGCGARYRARALQRRGTCALEPFQAPDRAAFVAASVPASAGSAPRFRAAQLHRVRSKAGVVTAIRLFEGEPPCQVPVSRCVSAQPRFVRFLPRSAS